jgi:hypothetical protein
MNPVEKVKEHPAETAMPLATILAALIAKALGVADTDTILYIALALSFIPAVVTWIVDLRDRKQSNATTLKRSNKSS